MVSSHTDRTSPVVRGKWVLENVLGTPPPAPPANVPKLDEIDPKGVMSLTAAARSAPQEPGVRGLSRDDGPDRVRAREFRRGRCVPRLREGRRQRARGRERAAHGRHRSQRRGRASSCYSQEPGGLRIHGRSEAHDVRIGSWLERATTWPSCARSSAKQRKDDYRFSSVVLGVAESVPFRERKAAGEGTVASVER